jgi:hypothetical protein
MQIGDRLGQSKGVAATKPPVDLPCQTLQLYQSPTPRFCIHAARKRVPWVSHATSASAWRRVVPGDHSFFQALGDLEVTGPTLTNVNDFGAILVDVA